MPHIAWVQLYADQIGNLMAFSEEERRKIRDAVRRTPPRSMVPPQVPPFGDPPFQFRRFELKDDLAEGGSAEAYVLTRAANGVITLPAIGYRSTFTVYDPWGRFTGTGRVETDTPPTAGTQGLAIHMHDGDYWEVIASVEGMGTTKIGVLSGTLEADGTATMTVLGGEEITVTDWILPDGESLASATKIMAMRIGETWYVVGAWITKTVVTDWQITGLTIQVKTADIIVFWAGDDSEWTTKHTGTEC
jgi:hypothetical protein